jgi:hypothetical protein
VPGQVYRLSRRIWDQWDRDGGASITLYSFLDCLWWVLVVFEVGRIVRNPGLLQEKMRHVISHTVDSGNIGSPGYLNAPLTSFSFNKWCSSVLYLVHWWVSKRHLDRVTIELYHRYQSRESLRVNTEIIQVEGQNLKFERLQNLNYHQLAKRKTERLIDALYKHPERFPSVEPRVTRGAYRNKWMSSWQRSLRYRARKHI